MEWVWRKGNPPTLLGEILIGTVTLENNIEVPSKTKNRHYMIQQPTPGHISRKDKKNSTLKRYFHPSVHSYTIYNSQDMGATNLSVHQQIKNIWGVCVCVCVCVCV